MFNGHVEYLLLFILLVPSIGSMIAFVLGLSHEGRRNTLNAVLSVITFLLVCYLYPFVKANTLILDIPSIMGTGLYLKVDMLRYVLIFISAFAFLLAKVFSLRYFLHLKNRNRYYLFFMLTWASTMGMFMSNQILNIFTFFEIMTVTSYFLVIHDEDEYTHKAGNIYIAMSLAGGLVQLMGIFMVYTYTNTLLLSELAAPFQALGSVKYVIATLVIIGFGVKACMFPLHIWLPKVYSPTPSPATAIFSGILTKTGVFGVYLVLMSLGFDEALSIVIVGIGLINMILGGFLAPTPQKHQKILAYSSMSQLGYIFLSIGLIGLLHGHTTMAFYGSVFHMVSHAMTKVLLFFGVGVIIMTTQKMSLNEIRGFGKHKPILKAVFFIGTLGTIGIPGFSGYASKTMIHHAIIEASEFYNPLLIRGVEVLYFLASAFTVAYLLKIYITVFVEENPEYGSKYNKERTPFITIPLVSVASIIVLLGFFPNQFLKLIGIASDHGYHAIHFFNFENLISTIIILAIGLVIYVFYVIGRLKVWKDGEYVFVNPSHHWFDLEKHLYRPVLLFIYKYVKALVELFDNILVILVRGLSRVFNYIFSIEFYKDVSYYRRIANYLISLKYRTLKMNSSHKHRDTFEYIEAIRNRVEENNGRFNKDLMEYIDEVREKVHETQQDRMDRELLEYLNSIHSTIVDSNSESTKAFSTYADTLREKININTDHLIEEGREKGRSFGYLIGTVFGKLSSITYSIIIFALILAALLVVLVVI